MKTRGRAQWPAAAARLALLLPLGRLHPSVAQWAQGRQTTHTAAAQADRTQTNASAFAPLIAEAKAREAQGTE